MQKQELVQKIQTLVAKSKIKEAIQLLLKHAEGDQVMINQLAKWHDLQAMRSNGTISYVEYEENVSRLRMNVLQYADAVEITVVTVEKRSIKDMEDLYKRSEARIVVIKLLKAYPEGLTIKELHEKSGLKQRKYLIYALEELIEVDLVERFRAKNRSLNKFSKVGKTFAEKLKY